MEVANTLIGICRFSGMGKKSRDTKAFHKVIHSLWSYWLFEDTVNMGGDQFRNVSFNVRFPCCHGLDGLIEDWQAGMLYQAPRYLMNIRQWKYFIYLQRLKNFFFEKPNEEDFVLQIRLTI